MKPAYHYEWTAFTDNLCHGRVPIARGRSRADVENAAASARKGCYTVKRTRVYEN